MNRRELLKALLALAGSTLSPMIPFYGEGEALAYDRSLRAAGWEWDKNGLMSLHGQSYFPMYAADGSLMSGAHSGVHLVYYYRGHGIVECERKTYPEVMNLINA